MEHNISITVKGVFKVTGIQKQEIFIEKSNGVITPKLARSYGIHREYLNTFVSRGS